MVGGGGANAIIVGLQVFGTLFIVLLAFLGMTAWIIRRIDRLADYVNTMVSTVISDLSQRVATIEGQLKDQK